LGAVDLLFDALASIDPASAVVLLAMFAGDACSVVAVVGIPSSGVFDPNHFPSSGAQNQTATNNNVPSTAAFLGLAVSSRRSRRIH
jgi:hypothetical protein